MSLLNDALRDLEQRQAPAEMLELPLLMQPAPRRAWQRGWLPGALVVASAAALGTGYWAWVATPADHPTEVMVDAGQRQLVEAETMNLVATEPALSPLVEPELPAAAVQVPEQPEPIATAAVVRVEPVSVEQTPAEPMAAVEPAPVVAAEPVQVAEVIQPAEAVQPADEVSQTAEPAQAETSVEIVKEPVAVAEVALPSPRTTMIRTLTPEQEDRQTALAAERLLRNGRTLDAEDLLRQYLAERPGAVITQTAYAQLLIRSGRTAQAAQVLESVDGRAPAELKQLKARLLHGQGQAQAALGLLRQNPPALSEQPDYHAFLAALQSEQGQFAEAAAIYAGLVGVRPRRADWWAGLGIALDGEGQPDGARRAYDQALALGGLHPELQAYVTTRRHSL